MEGTGGDLSLENSDRLAGGIILMRLVVVSLDDDGSKRRDYQELGMHLLCIYLMVRRNIRPGRPTKRFTKVVVIVLYIRKIGRASCRERVYVLV